MKVFVLGLDGATFDIIDPLIQEGMLPHISSMCSNGAAGKLDTIFPPVTGPAWLALATGLNPGKTGVFDYINKRNESQDDLIPISSAYYQDRSVWDYLGRNGYKVGIFNYPTLSPPPQVNGVAVSGMGSYSKEHLCYPYDLEKELDDVTGGYEIQLNLRSTRYRKDPLLFLNDVNRVLKKQAAALLHLVKTKEWDFFFAVFHLTDWMHHFLWKYLDRAHPLHNGGSSAAVQSKFRDTWRKIDSVIGELQTIISKNTTFFIVSDHGAGPLDSAFYPNTWLERKGWLKGKEAGWKRYIINKMKPLTADMDNKYFSRAWHFMKMRIMNVSGSLDLIDIENSMAYSPEHAGMFGCLNLTPKGRAQTGFKEQLIDELKQLPNTISGITSIDVYLPEQIYTGQYVKLAPDILFVVNGYKASVEIDLPGEPFIREPSIAMRTGGHLPNGVFIAVGDTIENAKLRNLSVLDLAPTILALYDVAVPAEIDGRVIVECIRPEVLRTLHMRKREVVAAADHQKDEKGDLDEMKRTLQSLGYM